MRKNILYLLLITLLFSSCSGYEKLLKSDDNNLKLEAAKKFYESKNYLKAIGLLDAVSPYFKGTDKSEEVLFLTAKSYLGNKDYYSANSYFTTYTKTFPKGKNAEESWFMIGYCSYQESPDTRLDQTSTIESIQAFTEFSQIYPNSPRIPEANKYLSELQDKLAYKAYLNAKLYFNLGNYLGNNYLSAVITAKNAIKDYPGNKYKEELSFLILKSKFRQAELSVPTKKEQRYRESIDEYYNFSNEYPTSEYSKDAQRIFKSAKSFVKE